MLTCDLCDEDFLLEEDMRTHLLRCPLCSLSAGSYNCFHVSATHPERAQDVAHFGSTLGCSAGTGTGLTERHQMSQSCQASEVALSSATPVTRDAAQLQRKSTPSDGGSSTWESAPVNWTLTSQSCPRVPKTKQDCVEDKDGVKDECDTAKQKPLSSPGDEAILLPHVALVCSSWFILREHVELHLQEQHAGKGLCVRVVCQDAVSYWLEAVVSCLHQDTPSAATTPSQQGEERLQCPLCLVACRDGFSLQEHVELHLDHGVAADSAGSDLKLARRLQQHEEEEEKRRLEEAQQERDGFKKLQRQFGLVGSRGYSRQMERSMERAVARGLMAPAEFHCKKAEMMESLASGLDDGRTRTQGVVQALYEYYQTECKDCVHVWLSADTGYLGAAVGRRMSEKAVSSIPRPQSMIEEAWRAGLDPHGASHFNQRLQGTRAWIGATEIYTLLTSLGIGARIMDFHKPTGPGDTHPRLFEWVKQYFQSGGSSRVPPRLIHTCLPPLYLQHQGHSRTIVGLEQKRNRSLCLLLLNPSTSASDARKLLSSDTISAAARRVRRLPGSLTHKQYQLVAVSDPMSDDEEMSTLRSRVLSGSRDPAPPFC